MRLLSVVEEFCGGLLWQDDYGLEEDGFQSMLVSAGQRSFSGQKNLAKASVQKVNFVKVEINIWIFSSTGRCVRPTKMA